MQQGNTTTVAAASLAGFYAGVKVGHVEAGLRTHDRWQPLCNDLLPEERVVQEWFHAQVTRVAGMTREV